VIHVGKMSWLVQQSTDMQMVKSKLLVLVVPDS
jgi:hypothetical protein